MNYIKTPGELVYRLNKANVNIKLNESYKESIDSDFFELGGVYEFNTSDSNDKELCFTRDCLGDIDDITIAFKEDMFYWEGY